jgi:predicted CXXCH cytochrome family protein
MLKYFVLAFMPVLAFSQGSNLSFSHQLHVQEAGASCSDCHDAAGSSKAQDDLLPKSETCFKCHDSKSECTLCHQDSQHVVLGPRIVSYIDKFSHQAHIDKKQDCNSCHAGVETSTDVKERHMPPMGKCVSCHNDMRKVDYCYGCHAKKDHLKPQDHDETWRAAHGIQAHNEKEICARCHANEYCLKCHEGDNLDRTVHPFNFRYTHGIQAKGSKETCYTCHEELAFCNECHRQEMVMPRSHASVGWSNRENGGAHARAAASDLEGCLSCHDDINGTPICAQCHTSKMGD